MSLILTDSPLPAFGRAWSRAKRSGLPQKIAESDIQEAFAVMRNDPSIPWDCRHEGCVAKAQRSSWNLEKHEIPHGKIFVIVKDGKMAVSQHPDWLNRGFLPIVPWRCHVGLFVISKNSEARLLDPGIADRPLSPEEWLNSMTFNGEIKVPLDVYIQPPNYYGPYEDVNQNPKEGWKIVDGGFGARISVQNKLSEYRHFHYRVHTSQGKHSDRLRLRWMQHPSYPAADRDLIQAASSGDLLGVYCAIKAGGNPNAVHEGVSAVIASGRCGQTAVLRYLIDEAGADLPIKIMKSVVESPSTDALIRAVENAEKNAHQLSGKIRQFDSLRQRTLNESDWLTVLTAL